MMYENATVLNYESKKIWIKCVAGTLYCVNGRWILFDKMQDLSNVSLIALSYDLFYDPLRASRLKDSSMISYDRTIDDELFYSFSDIDGCVFDFDVSNRDAVKSEYDTWSGSLSLSDIYIDDGRNDDIDVWVSRRKSKEAAAGWI